MKSFRQFVNEHEELRKFFASATIGFALFAEPGTMVGQMHKANTLELRRLELQERNRKIRPDEKPGISSGHDVKVPIPPPATPEF